MQNRHAEPRKFSVAPGKRANRRRSGLLLKMTGNPTNQELCAEFRACYKVRMKIAIFVLLTCALASPSLIGQEDTPKPPAVTKYECPQYPETARSAHISGTVTMLVTTDGHAVAEVKVISGPQILAKPAEANVRTWKFADHSPTTFKVVYVYTDEGYYKKDPVTKCAAKMNLPTEVTVSTKIPISE